MLNSLIFSGLKKSKKTRKILQRQVRKFLQIDRIHGNFSFHKLLDFNMVNDSRLFSLASALKHCTTDRERITLLDRDPHVQKGISNISISFSEEISEVIFKSLLAIEQEKLLSSFQNAEKLQEMIRELFSVEDFYKEIGGIVGYHETMCSSLKGKQNAQQKEQVIFHSPPKIDISSEEQEVHFAILQGIFSLPYLAEMYPVGGAADRLKFYDPETGHPLPAAKLFFCGRSLLERLILDIQAREYLYYKLFGEQLTTPIAMMTSMEKDNHRQILSLCAEKKWFGRPQDSFRFFCQPLVPTMDKEGRWCLNTAMKLLMKPGGHGVIWKVAEREGVFDWMQRLGREKILIRQINNPIAGVDYGLLAFCGVGFQEDHTFGFASCPRQVESAEGINVLIENSSREEKTYCLTNIEYCDFQKFSIEDTPVQVDSPYSRFPSNTNILFADINAMKQAVKKVPIPGMLVNLKKITVADEEGKLEEIEVARLESTMQNVADYFISSAEENLTTYLTYNQRRKTISTTKRQFEGGDSLLETPEGCFYDQFLNAYDLLKNYCKISLVPFEREIPFIFLYHPALGPLYSIIGQKIQGGSFALHSECLLEIAEAKIRNLQLTGSLHVIADQVMGEIDSKGCLRYSEKVGQCSLINVTVTNRGITSFEPFEYWKAEIVRDELCVIRLHGHAEFYAENVTFFGNTEIEVEEGFRLIAYSEAGAVRFRKEPLMGPSQNWIYQISDQNTVQLT